METDKRGWVEVICGCMFSGKTEELIRRVRRAMIATQPVQVFKPEIDKRYDPDKVTSHNGLQIEAVPVSNVAELRSRIDRNAAVVALDEVHFFDDDVVVLCEELANVGVRVIVAGLDMDFRGEPFGPMPQLTMRAERVTKLQAICVVCKQPASRSQRLIDGQPAPPDSPVVLVGEKDKYEARCRYCHVVPRHTLAVG